MPINACNDECARPEASWAISKPVLAEQQMGYRNAHVLELQFRMPVGCIVITENGQRAQHLHSRLFIGTRIMDCWAWRAAVDRSCP